MKKIKVIQEVNIEGVVRSVDEVVEVSAELAEVLIREGMAIEDASINNDTPVAPATDGEGELKA